MKRKRVKKATPPNTKGRILLLQAAFVLIIASMALRLYQLQIIQHDFYAQKVLPRGKSFQRSLTGQSALADGTRRGCIYDQKGRELAVSIRLDSVYGIPGQLRREDNDKIRQMCTILQIAPGSLESRLDVRNSTSRQHFIWVKRKITPQVVTRLEQLDIDGIGFREENQRYYPARELSAQLLGFTGIDNHGLEGVERFFDELLSGAGQGNPTAAPLNGRQREEMDSSGFFGSEAGSQTGERPEPCQCSILLSIDKVIQYQTEKELSASCTASRAKAGTAIVMDVKNGEILAMANWPPFNPNSFSKYPVGYRRNRCITDSFEPGSVFKIFLAAAALEAGKFDRNDVIYCENGVFQIGKRTIRDTHRHGWLTFGDIIRVSSNIGSAKVGLSLEREKFYRTIKDFGFGSRTGIQLPGEVQGIIPPLKRWTDLTTANISFGQGISITPVQLITAVSCLANKGCWREPRILKGVRSYGLRVAGCELAKPLTCPEPRGSIRNDTFRQVVSAATCETLIGMLERAVRDGTGTAASIPGYQVAGKTGTAQKVDPVSRRYSQDLFCSSFVGFFPASSPRVAILVTIDEPKEEHLAGVVAAPVFREIAKSIIRYWNLPPVQGEKKPSIVAHGATDAHAGLRLAGAGSLVEDRMATKRSLDEDGIVTTKGRGR